MQEGGAPENLAPFRKVTSLNGLVIKKSMKSVKDVLELNTFRYAERSLPIPFYFLDRFAEGEPVKEIEQMSGVLKARDFSPTANASDVAQLEPPQEHQLLSRLSSTLEELELLEWRPILLFLR